VFKPSLNEAGPKKPFELAVVMIVCVSPNLNIERTWVIPHLKLGGVFRAKEEIVRPSGKGINVAYAVHQLGEDVLGMGFAAGHTGRLFVEMFERDGLKGYWTWVEGEVRGGVTLYDPESSSDATLLSGRGMEVSASDWDRFSDDIMEQSVPAKLVSFSGSLPPGTPPQAFTAVIRRLKAAGKQVWVDCSDWALEAALKAPPTCLKINTTEAGELRGETINDRRSACLAALAFQQLGIETVVVTMGRLGAVLVRGSEQWYASAPDIQHPVSSVGSGDSFLGGLLVGLEQNQPLPECLRMAAAVGGANTQTLGAACFEIANYARARLTVNVERISSLD
jgi:1-phosphofructokinase family hexose kinase